MEQLKHDGLVIPGRVVLAHEPPFAIGRVHVEPATRQVRSGEKCETLEPRVMQVLVALGRAKGSIVTRDELIDRCWDGRIVGDDAINRTLSRIRQIASGVGGGSFKLETIARVGYRLLEHEHEAARIGRVRAASKTSRRTVLVGAAAALGAAGVVVSQRPWRHRPPAEARDLFRRGEFAGREGVPDQVRQATSFYQRAVQIDPDYAEAWGALALAFTHQLEGFSETEMASVPERIRSASLRARALDPNNADAQAALALIRPDFRNWTDKEADLRRLCARYPRHWLLHGRLAILLYEVGRLSDGIAVHRQVLKIDPMLPIAQGYVIQALSNLGRMDEAESLFRQVHDQWPVHPVLWATWYNVLLFSGRPEAAAAFIIDPDSLPSGFGPPEVQPRLRLAHAVETRQRADIEASVEDYRLSAFADVTAIPFAAAVFSQLGRLDLTFASLERYYFNRGSFGPPSAPIGPYTRRHTDILFAKSMAPARADPRFADLVRQIGLVSYWRETRTLPDYRRTG